MLFRVSIFMYAVCNCYLRQACWRSQRRLGAIKKNPLKKGRATDPIPATPRLSGELTFVVEKLSVELTFD